MYVSVKIHFILITFNYSKRFFFKKKKKKKNTRGSIGNIENFLTPDGMI